MNDERGVDDELWVGDRRCIEMGEVNRKKKEGRNFHKGQNTYLAIVTERKPRHPTSHTHRAQALS